MFAFTSPYEACWIVHYYGLHFRQLFGTKVVRESDFLENARHDTKKEQQLNKSHIRRDYRFIKLLHEAGERIPMRLLAYCLLPNHFHLTLWPLADGDLSDYMMWLLTAHVRRHHQHYHSSGHVWQGRFRAFPIQEDEHLLTVLRYIERNPVRAGLASSANDWKYVGELEVLML